mmetsp:Transcript_12548/g.33125  ORF Transcript_12548/g.33125 Transcript_12548/m.33125 type:complete len:287 (-) Transcript_12548:510-1370(-)
MKIVAAQPGAVGGRPPQPSAAPAVRLPQITSGRRSSAAADRLGSLRRHDRGKPLQQVGLPVRAQDAGHPRQRRGGRLLRFAGRVRGLGAVQLRRLRPGRRPGRASRRRPGRPLCHRRQLRLVIEVALGGEACVPGHHWPAGTALEGIQGLVSGGLVEQRVVQGVPVVTHLQRHILLVNHLDAVEVGALLEPFLLQRSGPGLHHLEFLEVVLVPLLQLLCLVVSDAADVHVRQRALHQEAHPGLLLGIELDSALLPQPLHDECVVKFEVLRCGDVLRLLLHHHDAVL